MKRYVKYAIFLLLILILGAGPILGKESPLTTDEAKDGWILLFDGESMFGLSQENPAAWQISDGVLAADGSGPAYIRTTSPFSDFALKFEFQLSNSSADAAIYIRTAKDGFPIDNGYQIRISDGNPAWPAGSIVSRFKANAVHPQAGQWHSLEIDAGGDHITVLLDAKTVVDGNDSTVRSGYVGFRVGSGAALQLRNVKLKPVNTTALFNGSDLTGWKTVTPSPSSQKPGALKKLLPFGGKPKTVKESVWSVQAGMIHGEKGPGQLETAATYEDFVLQFAFPPAAKKQQGRRTIYIRGDAGKLFTGYEVSMDPDRPGAIAPNLAAPRKIVSLSDIAVGTVVVNGRHMEIWVNGFPVTEFTDTRPDGASTLHNARTSAGAIALPLHDSNAIANYASMRLATVNKNLGGVVGKLPPPAPSPTATPAVAAATPAPPGAPVMVVNPQAQQDAETRKQIAPLMQQALASNDPQQQKELYGRIIALDPNNSAAAQGYKEAVDKIEQQAAETRKQSVLQTQTQQNEVVGNDALHKAEAAFLVGNLTTADSQLAIAERLMSNNPAVKALRQKVDAARAQNSRLRFLFFGGGFLALGGLSTVFLINLRKKHGFLEIVSGVDKGRRYNLDNDVVRIGAVAQDGSDKNDIIVRDIEHMVSRFHCEVHHSNGKFYLIDCNSANGTRIDKSAVPPGEPKRLKNGARVDLAGTVALRFGLERRKIKATS